MHLPPPSTPLTLPAPGGGLVIDNSEPPAPVWDTAKMLEFVPAWARRAPSAGRDAVLQAAGQMANQAWADFSRTLEAQTSPRFAAGKWLDWWGDIRKLPRLQSPFGPQETDADYRARLLGPIDRVAPTPIRTAVDALAVAQTQSHAAFLEPWVDAAFVSDPGSTSPFVAATPWVAFVQKGTDYSQGVQGASGRRMWALYPDSTSPNPGAYVVPGTLGSPAVYQPLFWIALPGDAGDDSQVAYVWSTTAGNPPVSSTDYVQSSANPVPVGLQSLNGVVGQLTPPLIETVTSLVEGMRGAGTQFFVFVDPDLRNGAL